MTTEKDTDFDRDEIKTMMEQATLSMTGHPVKIYLRAPIFKNKSGRAFRDRDGRFAFEIMPDLSLPAFYETWLHETCHLHLGHADHLLPTDIPEAVETLYLTNGPLIELTEEQEKEYQTSPIEVECNAVTYALDHFLKNSALQRYGNIDVLSCLRIAMTTQIIKRREDE